MAERLNVEDIVSINNHKGIDTLIIGDVYASRSTSYIAEVQMR